jgi:hypothetical protein
MERLGIVQSVVWLLPQLADLAFYRGNWNDADEFLERYERILQSMSRHYLDVQVGTVRARIASARIGLEATKVWERAVELGRKVKDPQALSPALSGYARFLLENGQAEHAVRLMHEMYALPTIYFAALIDVGWLIRDLGRPDEMRTEERGGLWAETCDLIAEGEAATAADRLADKGLHTEAAYARLRAAEELTGAARAAQLEPALAFYRTVGATSYVLRAEALLPASA